MAHAQKPDFVFRRNGRIHLNRRGRQFCLLFSAEVWASAVIMLDIPCSEVVWRVLATHSIRQFPLHFTPGASPCAITSQLNYTRWQEPEGLKGDRTMFSYFPLLSDVIREWCVVLLALAASGHLAYDGFNLTGRAFSGGGGLKTFLLPGFERVVGNPEYMYAPLPQCTAVKSNQKLRFKKSPRIFHCKWNQVSNCLTEG